MSDIVLKQANFIASCELKTMDKIIEEAISDEDFDRETSWSLN